MAFAAPGVQAEHEAAVAELADFNVEQKEKTFGDEKTRGPINVLGTSEIGPRRIAGGAKIATRRKSAPKRKRLRMTAGASMPESSLVDAEIVTSLLLPRIAYSR